MQNKHSPRSFIVLLVVTLLINLSVPAQAAEPPQSAGQSILPTSSSETISLAPVPPAGTPGDENWKGGFGMADMENDVSALAIDSNGDLYAAGDFITAGTIVANRIARWNGSAWNPIGHGFNDTVNALVFDSSGNLYAGGAFTGICADVPCTSLTPANRIAMWNGSAWSAVGYGFDNTVNALAFGDSNYLYAGGSFKNICDNLACSTSSTTNYIARWDGSVWNPTGPGFSDVVKALAYNGGNFLYAGGDFRYYCGSLGPTCGTANPANRIARWRVSATAWEKVGDGTKNGVSATVNALLFNSAGALYVGGDFVWICNTYSSCSSTSLYANRIARWSSETWSAMNYGVGAASTSVNALALDDSENLYIGGSFTAICGNTTCNTDNTTANRVATWSGSAWNAVGNGVNDSIYALAYGSGNLYAGGSFTGICTDSACTATTVANRLAKWDGTDWSRVNTASHHDVNGTVLAITFDAGGNMYIGGSFTSISGTSANRVAMWNGTSWTTLGFGLDGDINALAVDSLGNLYTGGSFTYICGNAACDSNTQRANRIARWVGGSWSNVGNGLNGTVNALTIDSSNNIYAGGAFTGYCNTSTCGSNTSANRVAKSNGTIWSAMNFGVGATGTAVNALALDDSGNLVIGGSFTQICGNTACNASNTPTNRAAIWNGSSWNAMSNGVNGVINALAFDQESWDLYAGGVFTGLCGDITCTITNTLTANQVAMWDSSAWSTVGNGVNDAVNTLAMDSGGNLYAGGAFTGICNDLACSSPTSARYIARWNNTEWVPMGIGTNDTVSALTFEDTGDLYIGGIFITAGIHASHSVASWTAAAGQCGLTSGSDYTLYAGSSLTVSLHINTPGTLDCIAVQRVNKNHPEASPYQQTGYYWSIQAVDSSDDPASNYDVRLTLPYANAGEGDQLCRYDSGPASWDCADDRVYVANTSVTRNHVIQFSDWAVGDFLTPKNLSVSTLGSGSGVVTSTPAGIDCGADCVEAFQHGTPVTLTASAVVNSNFMGWNGACTGVGPCTVTMTETQSITATFELNKLTVEKTGQGTVTSEPPGINCGVDCDQVFNYMTTVVLTATPATGWAFAGWGGSCTGMGPCVVTLDKAKIVTATFTLNGLAVSKIGEGIVSSEPPGIECGITCTQTFDYMTVVTLTATPATGWAFDGWSGSCTGVGACVITMDEAKSVTATFRCKQYLSLFMKNPTAKESTNRPVGLWIGALLLLAASATPRLFAR